jgi:phosphate/sulfate permease
MVTDVILLDTFNSLGMPTSTTVSLVFELLGGTVALALIKSIASEGQLTFAQMINTDKVLTVVLGIFLSIAIAFFFGMLVQWITRVVFTFNYKKNLKWFAGIFGGVAVTSIVYFMLFKGLKDSSFMTPENKKWITENTGVLLSYIFLGSAVLMQNLHWCKVNIFKFVVLLGTFSLAMAFAGNDLVNFIGIPLTGLASYQDYMANGQALGVDGFTLDSLNGPANTPVAFLLLAGAIMVFALVTSKKAHNVIKTSVNLSKQDDGDEMFGTSRVARQLVLTFNSIGNWFTKITPEPMAKWIDTRFNKDEIIMEQGAAFDQLRAAINLVMAALLIAVTALPAFAAEIDFDAFFEEAQKRQAESERRQAEMIENAKKKQQEMIDEGREDYERTSESIATTQRIMMTVVIVLGIVVFAVRAAEAIYVYNVASRYGLTRLWALLPLVSAVLGLLVLIFIKSIYVKKEA